MARPPSSRGNITRQALSERIADRVDVPQQDIYEVMQVLFEEMVEELAKGHRLEFRNFGAFRVDVRASRRGFNPQTKETIEIAAAPVVRFKASRHLRQRLEENAQQLFSSRD